MAPVAARPSHTPLGGIVKGGLVQSLGSLVGVVAAYFVMWDTVGLNRGHG